MNHESNAGSERISLNIGCFRVASIDIEVSSVTALGPNQVVN